MVNVSSIDVIGSEYGVGSFCRWASAQLGIRLKFLTEAQFEYASRTGQSGSEYPWGNTFDHSKLWGSKIGFEDASRTAPVSRASNIYTNAFSLLDMCGNVQ
jgi:formylglycine-generating enzyme required for sulfatase activity